MSMGGGSTWLGIYGYTQEGVISNADWFNRAKEHNIFSNAWHIFTQFSHLQTINLRFLEGVIWEDVLFAELLFAQSERIAILPKMLVNYRVRQNNTTNFSGVKQKNLPPFVRPLEKYFSDSNEAWAYFSAFSWCAMASEFVKFCNSYGDKAICEKLKECFLGHLLSESCAIMNFKADPYNVRDYFLTLAKRFGKKYLPRDKKRFAYYNTPILWQIYNIYPLLKSAERNFRRWRKGLFKKIDK